MENVNDSTKMPILLQDFLEDHVQAVYAKSRTTLIPTIRKARLPSENRNLRQHSGKKCGIKNQEHPNSALALISNLSMQQRQSCQEMHDKYTVLHNTKGIGQTTALSM